MPVIKNILHIVHRYPLYRAIVSLLAVGLLASAAACTHPVRRLVFQPHMIEVVPAFPKHVSGLERFWLDFGRGRVEGWLLMGQGVSRHNRGPAVMIAHGNRELIDHYLHRALKYRSMGFTVLMGEYRGYGRSDGRPSRKKIRSDYIRFYDKLASLPGVDPGRIVFHGRSLGGAVLADLAAYKRPAAVILESTFTSIKAMAHGAPNFMLSDNYNTLSAMAGYDGPVLIVHGTRDRVVPFEHALELQKAIAEGELFSGDFGHNDMSPDWTDYWLTIREFLNKYHLAGIE